MPPRLCSLRSEPLHMLFDGQLAKTKWATNPTGFEVREAATALHPQQQQYTALVRESKNGKFALCTADSTRIGPHVRRAAALAYLICLSICLSIDLSIFYTDGQRLVYLSVSLSIYLSSTQMVND